MADAPPTDPERVPVTPRIETPVVAPLDMNYDTNEEKNAMEIVYMGAQPPAYVEKEDIDWNVDEKKDGEEAHKKDDKYDVMNMNIEDAGPAWKDMTTGQRTKRVVFTILGICVALGLLYVFICSLDILTSAFQLLAGRVASDALSNDSILDNPIAGLMLGVLATVLLQSSSTSTSIVVTLVGSGVISVEQAIYVIMGTNIGTSVTNTIVSMTQSTDKQTFRLSFAGATVHDMFNWLTVLILLPLEAASGYLFVLTEAITKNLEFTESGSQDEPQFLKVITDPLTSKIIKVDKAVLNAVAEGTDRAKYPICKYYCDTSYNNFMEIWPLGEQNETYIEAIQDKPWTINVRVENDTDLMQTNFTWQDINNDSSLCTHHFTGCAVEDTWCSLSDQAVGGVLLACSMFVLLTSIFTMVKVLNFILKGPMAKAVRVGINANLPGKAKFLTGYIAMLIGAGITMLVQSSSVFTSSMTPLVGMGLISVERMFPLTLGSNIGTCLTGILAALTAEPDMIRYTLQVSLAHLFFNITGIILFYPIPFMRKLPLNAAKFMGNTTANYRWFAIAYILMLFLLIPGAIFALSMAGWQVFIGVMVPVAAVVIAIVVIKLMQHYCPMKMHPCMRNWNWLPKPLRSLEPCNSAITKCCYNESCVNCRKQCCCDDSDDEDADNLSRSSRGSSFTSEPSPSGSAVYTIDQNKLSDLLDRAQAQCMTEVVIDAGHSNPAFQSETMDHTKL